MSDGEIVFQIGAADTEPVPVCVKNFSVVVVLPANLASVFVAEAYSVSPRV